MAKEDFRRNAPMREWKKQSLREGIFLFSSSWRRPLIYLTTSTMFLLWITLLEVALTVN